MRRIYRLANRVRVVIVGNTESLIFDDNTKVPVWTFPEPPYNMDSGDIAIVCRKNRQFSVATNCYITLAAWIIEELEYYIDLYKREEIDIIMCMTSLLPFVYKYCREFDVPVYSSTIFDWDDDVAICKIDLFLEYNPNTI